MEYKVPQDIDIEDKVIGPMSLRQFIIILIGVGLITFFYFTFQGFLRIFFYLFGMLTAGVVFVLAFAKYGDQSSEIFALSAIKTLTSPRKRIWKKEDVVAKEVAPVVAPKEEPKPREKKNLEEIRDDLSRLAEVVDSGYSALEQKDRLMSFDPNTTTTDFATNPGKPAKEIEGLLNDAAKKAPKREPLISQLATVSPTKEFNYAQVKDSKDRF